MTIHLPKELETSLQDAVHGGISRPSMTRWPKPHACSSGTSNTARSRPQPILIPCLGSMSDHAELMDQIVEDAMRHREQQPWRLNAGE